LKAREEALKKREEELQAREQRAIELKKKLTSSLTAGGLYSSLENQKGFAGMFGEESQLGKENTPS